MKFLDLHHQYLSIKSEIDDAIASVLADTAFIGGKYVKAFESEFAAYLGVAHCLGVGNGTDALEIAIEALDLPAGSEIIVPANSFIASSEAVTRCGHKVVFADVNTEDYTLDIADVAKNINRNTSAILAVHLYGHPCDMDPLLELARINGLKVIEDCAQAHGAEYKGKKVGSIGCVGCFSFYPGKNLGAYGDGGAIVSNDDLFMSKSRMIANHGRIDKYDHHFEGRNSRLDGLQAAILSVKLNYLEEWTEHRILIADEYIRLLANMNVDNLPRCKDWARHVYHLFVLRVANREAILEAFKKAGVECGIHYPIALPKLKAYSYLKPRDGFAWRSDKELISLPIGNHVSVSDCPRILLPLAN